MFGVDRIDPELRMESIVVGAVFAIVVGLMLCTLNRVNSLGLSGCIGLNSTFDSVGVVSGSGVVDGHDV